MHETDLPDVNVWLALAVPGHAHHDHARRYWQKLAASKVAFTRLTMIGMVRLLGNRALMRGEPLPPNLAWRTATTFRALPEVAWLSESGSVAEAIDHRLDKWTEQGLIGSARWTDAWLAALSTATNSRLVSFDRGFEKFPGVSLLNPLGSSRSSLE